MGTYLAILSLFLIAAILPGEGVFRQLGFVPDFLSFTWRTGYTTSVALMTLIIFYVFTTLSLVCFAAGRTIHDRIHENPVFYTTLPPGKIVLGKLLFGTVVSLLFLSVTLPFLSVVYTMRGVDPIMLVWATLIFYGLIQVQYFVTVMFYSGATNPLRAFLLTLPLGGIQILLTFAGLFGVTALAMSFSFGDFAMPRWVVALMLVSFFAVCLTFAAIFTLIQYSPPSSNRMLPVRLVLTAVQVLLLMLLLVSLVFTDNATHNLRSNVIYQLIGTQVFFCFTMPYFFPVFICERQEYSPRIRRTIPRSFWKRLLVFPFYTGAPNAMAWCVSAFLLEGLFLSIQAACFGSGYHWFDYGLNGLGAGLLFFDYCATVLLLYNILLYRYFSRSWNWVPVFALFGGFGGMIFFAILTGWPPGFEAALWLNMDRLFFLPNPLCIDDVSFVRPQLYLALGWAVGLACLGLPWIRRHFKEFRPPQL